MNNEEDKKIVCKSCGEEKDSVKGRRIFIKKEYFCDDCYPEHLRVTQKYLLILTLISLIPLLIGLWLDFSESTDLEFGSCTLIVCGIMGIATASGLPKWILGLDKEFTKAFDNDFKFRSYWSGMNGDVISPEYSIIYFAIKFVVFILKIFLAGAFYIIYVLYNIIKLYNITLLRKNLNGLWRFAIIFGTFFFLFYLWVVNFG